MQDSLQVSSPAEERQIRVCNYFSLKTLDVSGKFAVYAVYMSPVNTKRNDRLTKTLFSMSFVFCIFFYEHSLWEQVWSWRLIRTGPQPRWCTLTSCLHRDMQRRLHETSAKSNFTEPFFMKLFQCQSKTSTTSLSTLLEPVVDKMVSIQGSFPKSQVHSSNSIQWWWQYHLFKSSRGS